MRLVLISGMRPEYINQQSLADTLLAAEVRPEVADACARMAGRPVDLSEFRYRPGGGYALLRPGRGVIPHLPTAALQSILNGAAIDYDFIDTERIWDGTAVAPAGRIDLVAISTTFVWSEAMLTRLIRWAVDHAPDAMLVLGGQYATFKYREILAAHPEVDYTIRGDGEVSFPAFVRAIDGRGDLADVPNLAWRGTDGRVVAPPEEYIDLESYPSPCFDGEHAVVPYESMRGCPFDCKFCSFPRASPEWRYKSADKIVRDWSAYADRNGARVIKARDSAFTVPPTRLKLLMEWLPALGLDWEAYSRANSLVNPETIDQLEASHCKYLIIGFESMSPVSLKNMSKRVSADQNVQAIEALWGRGVEFHGSFIAGYPGESPEDYEHTHRFLVDRYHGRFNVYIFMFMDETMPVWEDAPMYDLQSLSGWTWKHSGMTSQTAMKLQGRTIREVRWKNDDAVLNLWQANFARPMVSTEPFRAGQRIEEAIERLAFCVSDFGEHADTAARCRGLLDELESLGVDTGAAAWRARTDVSFSRAR